MNSLRGDGHHDDGDTDRGQEESVAPSESGGGGRPVSRCRGYLGEKNEERQDTGTRSVNLGRAFSDPG
jgi:hypothetical protein